MNNLLLGTNLLQLLTFEELKKKKKCFTLQESKNRIVETAWRNLDGNPTGEPIRCSDANLDGEGSAGAWISSIRVQGKYGTEWIITIGINIKMKPLVSSCEVISRWGLHRVCETFSLSAHYRTSACNKLQNSCSFP
jgi:hypothetical protein